MTQDEHTTDHAQDATGTGEQATKPGYSGLATHLAWALHLDEKQAEKVSEIAAQWSEGEGEYAFSRCESPAERLFLMGATMDECIGIEWRKLGTGDWYEYSGLRVWFEDEPIDDRDFTQVLVQPDLRGSSTRRPDFLFVHQAGGITTVLDVEVDGHDYHSTKEQLAADHERDIELLLGLGMNTIRFTGSQVYADPGGCFRTAIDVVRDLSFQRRRLISFGEKRTTVRELPALTQDTVQ